MDFGFSIRDNNVLLKYSLEPWKRTASDIAKPNLVLNPDEAGALKDEIIYEVYNLWKTNPALAVLEKEHGLMVDLTVMNKGILSKSGFGELYLTKGHIHEKKTGELYILLKGKAYLLMFSPEKNQLIVVLMKEKTAYIIPKGHFHRIVSAEKSYLVNAVPSEAGHDYDIFEKKGIPMHILFNKKTNSTYFVLTNLKTKVIEKNPLPSGKYEKMLEKNPDELRKLLII